MCSMIWGTRRDSIRCLSGTELTHVVDAMPFDRVVLHLFSKNMSTSAHHTTAPLSTCTSVSRPLWYLAVAGPRIPDPLPGPLPGRTSVLLAHTRSAWMIRSTAYHPWTCLSSGPNCHGYLTTQVHVYNVFWHCIT